MNESCVESCINTLKLIAQPTRWRILEQLGKRPANVITLSRRLRVSRHSVGKHLLVLRRGNIVQSEERGRETVYSITTALLPGGNGHPVDFGCCCIDFSNGKGVAPKRSRAGAKGIRQV